MENKISNVMSKHKILLMSCIYSIHLRKKDETIFLKEIINEYEMYFDSIRQPIVSQYIIIFENLDIIQSSYNHRNEKYITWFDEKLFKKSYELINEIKERIHFDN